MTTKARVRPLVTIEARALDFPTAAAVYGISETTLRELVDFAAFPSVRIGVRRVIPVAQADAWFADRANGVPVEIDRGAA